MQYKLHIIIITSCVFKKRFSTMFSLARDTSGLSPTYRPSSSGYRGFTFSGSLIDVGTVVMESEQLYSNLLLQASESFGFFGLDFYRLCALGVSLQGCSWEQWTRGTYLQTWREKELAGLLSTLSVANIFRFLHIQEVPPCLLDNKEILIVLIAHQRWFFILRWDTESKLFRGWGCHWPVFHKETRHL